IRLAVAGRGDPIDNGYTMHMGFVHVFDVERQTRLWRLRLGSERVPASSVAWHPNGTHLVGGNEDGLAMVWEIATGRPVARAPLHRTIIRALDWSPDGRRVASAGKDGALKIWDPATGDELCALVDRGNSLTAVKWSSNGRVIAAADVAGRISAWDASAGYENFTGAGRTNENARMREALTCELIDIRDLAGAIVQISLAIESAPGGASYRWLRGLLYTRLGQLDEALVDLSVAIALEPDNATFLRDRVNLYAVRGDWKVALTDALHVFNLKQDAHYQYEVAMVYLKLGQTAEYQQLCQEMFEQTRDDVLGARATDAAWIAALMPDSLPDLQSAAPVLREAVVRNPDDEDLPIYLLSLGALLYRTGHVEEAIEPLSRVSFNLEEFELNADAFDDVLPGTAWYMAAMAHHNLGHYQEARKWCDKAEAYTERTFAQPAAVQSRMFNQPEPTYWYQRVALEQLQHEARTVLNALVSSQHSGSK
ncbi:MAG: tetratricopeptide repeat protein, partial [Planctomycetaceae bacterium]|nr:tetratricopeptide repeat protein [Planctomycetaceae bacterium]